MLTDNELCDLSGSNLFPVIKNRQNQAGLLELHVLILTENATNAENAS